jgi:hypothetical protein
VLDAGCGTGELSAAIAARGARVLESACRGALRREHTAGPRWDIDYFRLPFAASIG